MSSADSKVRLALQTSIKHSGSEGVKVYERRGISPVELYERVGKAVILGM